jgi:hypothetical protein
MTEPNPSCLLYLLIVGREKELVLQVHGDRPTEEEIVSWMQDGTVQRLQVSSHGEPDTFTLAVNFDHVVGARLASYGESRSASF